MNWRRITVALSGHCWRNIPISLIEAKKANEKAQSCATLLTTIESLVAVKRYHALMSVGPLSPANRAKG
jgi:hypothetical protein